MALLVGLLAMLARAAPGPTLFLPDAEPARPGSGYLGVKGLGGVGYLPHEGFEIGGIGLVEGGYAVSGSLSAEGVAGLVSTEGSQPALWVGLRHAGATWGRLRASPYVLVGGSWDPLGDRQVSAGAVPGFALLYRGRRVTLDLSTLTVGAYAGWEGGELRESDVLLLPIVEAGVTWDLAPNQRLRAGLFVIVPTLSWIFEGERAYFSASVSPLLAMNLVSTSGGMALGPR